MHALQTRKGRAELGRFLAEGVRVVEDLLASPLRVEWAVTSSSVEDTDRGRALVVALESRGIPTTRVTERDFERLAATDSPQGVLAVAEIPQWTVDSIVSGVASGVVLVLDGVQDPGNFGTLARSAEALGAIGVIALPGTVDPWNPKAVRSAAGATFRVPVTQAGVGEAFAAMRGGGFEVLGADAAGVPIGKGRKERVALVVGNEGAGLSAEVRADVDGLVSVPMRGRAESLNVAAAAAILLYELNRQ